FAVTTADYVALAGGGRFDAHNAGGDVLTAASPETFGFLSSPASVSFDHSQLEPASGKAFTVIAGDISLGGARITGASGHVNLLSAASPGTASVAGADLAAVAFRRFGTVS